MSAHANPEHRNIRASTQQTYTEGGGHGWVTGECGHSWWATNVAGALSAPAKGKTPGRKCPVCRKRSVVVQGRPTGRCVTLGCGAVLSVYNPDKFHCQVHKPGKPGYNRPTT